MRVFELEDHVKLETREDIVNRPEHQALVDTQKLRSYRVKGLYAFEEQEASCGASACKKNHNRGFLVVYSGEKETNLCEECGQRLIGTSYKEQEQVLRIVPIKGVLKKVLLIFPHVDATVSYQSVINPAFTKDIDHASVFTVRLRASV